MQYQDMTKKEMQREYHRLCQRYQEYEGTQKLPGGFALL